MQFLLDNWVAAAAVAGFAFGAFKWYARRSAATWDDRLVSFIESNPALVQEVTDSVKAKVAEAAKKKNQPLRSEGR